MIYLELFLSFLQIGAFSFGGGYAAMPLIQEQIITNHHWLTEAVFADLVTIAEMTPGPIIINAATFVGTQVAGPWGAISATVGAILPSCIFVTILVWIYNRYRSLKVIQGTLGALRPAVVSMIAKAGLTILLSCFFIKGKFSLMLGDVNIRMVLYFVAALILLRKRKVNPILVMVMCGVMELLFTLFIK